MSEAKKSANQELSFGHRSFALLSPRPYLESYIADEKEVRGLQVQVATDARKSLQSPHLAYWLGDFAGNKLKRQEILAKIRQQDIVDLGAGATPGVFREMFRLFQARSYIGVDLFVDAEQPPRIIDGFGEIVEETYEPAEDFSSVIIRGEILEVASRLPSGEFSVFINGLDDYVLPERDHRVALQIEIERLTKLGGMVFGYTGNAGLLAALSQRPGFETIRLPFNEDDKDRAFYFLTKVAEQQAQ